MDALIASVRAPFAAKLDEQLATTEGLLYRRGNFNGTSDQIILDALLAEKNAQIAFSPGFRWGTSLLAGPGDHDGASDRPDGDHLSVRHRQRTHRRDDQDDPRGRRRQSLQSRSVLPAGRRHGARRRHRRTRSIRAPHRASASRKMELDGKPIEARQDVQGRRLGAGVGRVAKRRRRADLGRVRALPARAEDDHAAQAQLADDRGDARAIPGMAT